MDKIHGNRIRAFSRHLCPLTIEHEDNAIALLAMSRDLNVPFDELCFCVWLQVCIAEGAGHFGNEILDVVAHLVDATVQEVCSYLDQRIELFHNLGEIEREVEDRDGDLAPWQTEEALLEDLLLDAILDGE